MKYKAFVTLYRRPEVTRICFEGLKRLQQSYDIDVFCVGDEMQDMVEEYGFQFCHQPNRPLGRKCNKGLQEAMKDPFDYLLIVNTDDIISDSLFEIYKDYHDHYMVGVKGCYFYHDGKMKYFDGYKHLNLSMGPGRIIHRSVIEKCKGVLWGDTQMKGLNQSCLRHIRYKGFDETIIDVKDKAYIIDIKTDVNIHRYDQFEGVEVDPEDVLSHFSESERELLKVL